MADILQNRINSQPVALTVAEFCEQVRISQSMAFKLMREKKLKSIKVGRRTVIPATEIDRLLAGEMGDNA